MLSSSGTWNTHVGSSVWSRAKALLSLIDREVLLDPISPELWLRRSGLPILWFRLSVGLGANLVLRRGGI